jgi:hypothetical protein
MEATMPLDLKDPHVALGYEHGREGRDCYTFQDAENQRRYLLGYATGAGARAMTISHEQSLSQFEKLARQFQGSGQSRYMQQAPPVWRTKV